MARGKGLDGYGDPFKELGGLEEKTEEQKEQAKQEESANLPVSEKEKDPQPITEDQPVENKETEPKVSSSLSKYKKKPKYETHVAHNIRIPREMRQDMEKIAKKLGIPLRKNTGFFQEFTIDALRPAIEKAKKELGIE
ncbi:hypothetical protein H1164_15720 [Thermoactinomyces daqus]|uniref:Uncharacterized protein n=1 Tax=Thermoactinomyces daqus TaxID=1329516 RepID=A0A7W1XCV1_9BACL|nr:hypothetical protein [Thermoactinomyces daqus]MBA4544300.1 hypothetical protein [Thermoactinomyces daqus]